MSGHLQIQEQFEIIKNKDIRNMFFMIKEFINLYNNLVNLSRNKNLFAIFTDKDTFSDRILILLFHFAFF